MAELRDAFDHVAKDLSGGPWKSRIAEPKAANGYLRWRGDDQARTAVYGNLRLACAQ
jgi:hypothetical protein